MRTALLRLLFPLLVAFAFLQTPTTHAARSLDLDQATIADLNTAFAAGTLTSEQLVQRFLARIDAYDRKGPSIHAVMALNPKALELARSLDAERKAKGPRSPLHGIPVVLKDNVDTADLPTTGGSMLLEGSLPPDDAFIVKKLRASGAIIFGQGEPFGVRICGPAQLARRPDVEPPRSDARRPRARRAAPVLPLPRATPCSASAPTPEGRSAGRPPRMASSG
jgi:Amidase